ncbi:MAG: ABC transporter ATP-binding protein [Candidatus Thorarchaeota archaeon]|nr:MAG: ABC transporter ATP-binding protein [Candidatus Thorarchaeota archaeon]
MVKGDPQLIIENLKAYYPSKKGLVRAVDDVSLTVREGECVGLLGESGSGKTSMALAILGLFDRIAKFTAGASNDPELRQAFAKGIKGEIDRPGVQGSIIFRGQEMVGLPTEELIKIRGKQLSLIPQGLGHALNPQHSIGHQTAEPMEIHEEEIRLLEMKRKVLEYLGIVQLADAGIRFVMDPGSFSGGESQRILIAMALIAGPYMVIADEPTSALDVTMQRQILNVLRMIKEEFDVSLLLISHDAGVIAELSDIVAVMYCGKIVESGPAVQMFHTPKHPYTKGLMSSFPTIAMMQMKAGKKPRLRGIPGDPPDLTEVPSGCSFHPRCQYAEDICRTAVPQKEEIETDHFIRCHRWKEISEE